MTQARKRLLPLLLSISLVASTTTVCIADEINQVPPSGELSVAANQALAIDFGQLGTQGLLLNGDLNNSGTIFAFTSDPNVSVAQFTAQNITNNTGGLITSVMPAGGFAGLNINPAFLANSLSLSFMALNNFTNQGQITSAGNLAVTAGNTITNTNTAVMSAVQNIDMSAVTAIINSGLISAQVGNLNAATSLVNNQSGILQSLGGSVNISSIADQALVIQNALGQITAQNNVSIVNDLLQSSTQTILDGIALQGGSVTGENINFTSPTNAVHIDAGSLDGTVNIDAALTSVQVAGGELKIGKAILTNDPIFLNGNGSLVLTIPGNTDDLSGTLNSYFFTSGQNFIALASGDVTITGTGTIDASNAVAQSVIRIGAGVTFDGSGNITGGSATGGNLSMPQINLVNYGGVVHLQARNDSNVAGKGDMSVGSITTTGFDGTAGTALAPGGNGGSGGTVVLNAGNNITIPSIITSGGTGGIGFNGSSGTDFTGSVAAGGSDAVFGTGGRGSDGANGGDGANATAGGAGGTAGSIFITSNNVANIGTVIANGGRGGAGGVGGDGGAGQQGGKGGDMYGAGTGGRGGNGGFGGAGGLGADGGAGGRSGQVAISAYAITLQDLSATGGFGGAGGRGGDGGAGGDGGRRGAGFGIGVGGSGGDGNYGGDGGDAGSAGAGGATQIVTLTSADDILVLGPINISGGVGGSGGAGGTGAIGGIGQDGGGNLGSGSGGSSGNGGSGGSGAGGGNGGAGGTLNATVTERSFFSSGSIFTFGGEGGNGGNGGDGNNAGATGSAGTSAFSGGDGGYGGDGGGAGSGGGGGAGGNGGNLNISAVRNVSVAGNLHSYGGEGGNGGNSGAGGAGAGGSGGGAAIFGAVGLGEGGYGGQGGEGGSANSGGGGGSGGNGGNISVEALEFDIFINPPGGPQSGNAAVTNAAFTDGTGANVYLTAGSTSIDVPTTTGYFIGQRILLINNAKSERVTITNIAGNTLSVTPLTNSYLASFVDGAQTVAMAAPEVRVAQSGVVSAGGTGGAGGNGGDGGAGGNGASSGVGVFIQGATNGETLGGGTFFGNVGVSFNIGIVGASGGSGGIGGQGGMGGIGGNGGDIAFFAPEGRITVNGNVNASGNNSGNPGVFGLAGRDGSNGATRVFLGLTLGLSLAEDASFVSSIVGPTLGLLGAITIDNFTVGALGLTDPFRLGRGGTFGGGVLFVNHANLQGESIFNAQVGIVETFTEPVYISVTSRGQSVSLSLEVDPTSFLAGTGLIGFQGVGLTGAVPGNTVDLSQGLADVSGGNNVISQITGFGRGIVPPVLTNTVGTVTGTVGGVTVTLPAVVDFVAGPPSTGGNVHFLAGQDINIGGGVYAAGGTAISVTRTNFTYSFPNCNPCFTLKPVADLGRGGAINLQGTNITITGTSAVQQIGFAKPVVISAGSINFLTQPGNIDFLIKPVVFGDLTWTTQLGLNIAGGNGYILETSPTTIIQNPTGDVNLTPIIVGAGGNYTVNGDLVVLAKGHIVAPGLVSGSITTVGSTTRPTGAIIMAAGDIASTVSYGQNAGQHGWLVVGGPSATGGDIYLPSITIGSAPTYMVNLSAHSSPAADQAPFGSVAVGTVTTAQNQTIGGIIRVSASQDIVATNNMTTDFISLNSARGNIGSINSSLRVNSPWMEFNSFAATYINAFAPSFNLLESQGGSVSLTTAGNMNVVGPLTGGAVVISANTLSIQDSITAPGPQGVIAISTAGNITDGIGLANLSGTSILLESTAGSINISGLTAPDSVILTTRAVGTGITATSINTDFLGVTSSTGGVTIGTTNAPNVFARSDGDVSISSTSAVTIGGLARFPSRGRNFQITAPGITVAGVVHADQTVLLDSSSSAAGVFLNRNVSAVNSVEVRSGGSILQTNSMVVSPVLTLVAVDDIGAPLKPLVNTASTLNLPAVGRDFYIYNDNPAAALTLTTGFTGRNFIMMEIGDLIVNGAINATQKVALAALGGASLFVNQSVSGNTVSLQGTEPPPGINRVDNGAIIQSAGVVTASTLFLRSGAGGISSTMVGNALQTAVSGSIDYRSGGSVVLNNTGVVTDLTGKSASFAITNDTSIALGDMTTSNGNLSVTTAGGVLSVKDYVHVLAHEGNITMKNLSLAGTIVIGAHDAIMADRDAGAVVEISLGPGVPVRTNTVSPSPNIISTTAAGSQNFFGSNGIVASAPTNLVKSRGANSAIVFDTAGAAAGAISIGGQSVIGASLVAPLTSLDLSDPAVATEIRAQQNAGLLGGFLVLNAAGQAIAGSLIVLQTDIFTDLSGLAVPQNVFVNFRNFISPMDVDISSTTFTDQVQINGNVLYTGIASPVATINILSTQNPTVFSMANTGSITAPGALTITGNGSMLVNGPMSGILTMQTNAGSGGNITFGPTALVSSPLGPVQLLADGGISLASPVYTGGNLTVRGNGNVTSTNIISSLGTTAELRSNTGNFSSTSLISAPLAHLTIAANGALTTTGFVTARQLTMTAASIAASGGLHTNNGNMSLTAGSITTSGIVYAGNGALTLTSTAGDIVTSSFITAYNNARLNATGNILLNAPGNLSSLTGLVELLASGNITSNSLIFAAGNVNIAATGNVAIGGNINAQGASLRVVSNTGTITNTAIISGPLALVELNANGTLTTSGTLISRELALTGSTINASGFMYAYNGPVNAIAVAGGITTSSYIYALQDIRLQAAGNIFSSGFMNGRTLTLETTGASNGSITYNASGIGINGVTMTTVGTGIISNGPLATMFSYLGPVTLTSAGVNLSGNAIFAPTQQVSVNPNNNASPIFIGGAGAGLTVSQPSLNAILANTITVGNPLQTGGVNIAGPVSISSSNVAIVTGGAYNAAGQTVTLGAGRTLLVTAAGSIDSGTIAGTFTSRVTLNAGSAGLGITGPINAPFGVVNLSTGANGNITLNNPVNVTGGTLNIAAGGAGSISGAGLLSAMNLNLSSGTGSIGSGVQQINTAANNIAANTGGTGSVFLNNTGGVTLLSSSSGGSFSLQASGPMTIGNIQTNSPIASTNGSITLHQTAGGLMTINGNLTANGGSIQIQNSDTVTGLIMIGFGAQINTLVDMGTPLTNGQISIFIGSATPPVAGSAPARLNVTPPTAPGSYFFGNNPAAVFVIGVGPTAARVDAHGRDVIFNSPNPARLIFLNQNVLIKADPPAAASPYTPIGFVSTPAPLVPATAQVSVLHDAEPRVTHRNGTTLYAPKKDIQVQTDFGTVHINKGAIVLIAATHRTVSIFDLHDDHAKDVQVSLIDRSICLAPGTHLMFTDKSAGSMGDVNLLEPIGHRNINSRVSGATKEFSSEFSIASAISQLKFISAMQSSKDTRDVGVYKKLVKTAVVLSHMGAAKGSYHRLSSKPARISHASGN